MRKINSQQRSIQWWNRRQTRWRKLFHLSYDDGRGLTKLDQKDNGHILYAWDFDISASSAVDGHLARRQYQYLSWGGFSVLKWVVYTWVRIQKVEKWEMEVWEGRKEEGWKGGKERRMTYVVSCELHTHIRRHGRKAHRKDNRWEQRWTARQPRGVPLSSS